ncbi:5-methyltetrahydropteroyltriglutamate--homocysteine S-methyltransferase [Frischella sp. Ac48]|uniref:5-methyltetrahydropteroyltriglutamate--homocysteine methyltransferase n=1 Tax=Frischella japonica TaxID=2741544 RepID=A0ABR7R0Y3_9GAMM|nr:MULTISPECIES: 5-methyltetrahydropteroyltriglutamate--homocysteine S-methyltransferase [Frischella]MBC9131958.1 5-methyltetrahydropteroyltriglutamate--homocysteine S-methyltransferase [Frischella japonica]MBX4132515.1 5-methyltetrahydropteroyltriglutamate--homocysteine S-methyltransferase [Frischella sp. Ac48]
MATSVIGYPRIGKLRELKFAIEGYFKGDKSQNELLDLAQSLRKTHWQDQKQSNIRYISSNDFSFYDAVLDTACLLNIIPKRYQQLGLAELDQYFAMARGYQGDKGDVHALAMKKWFNTNYHYLVPEIEEDTEIKLVGKKPFNEYLEAKQLGIDTKPVIIGPLTLLKLAKRPKGQTYQTYVAAVVKAYQDILHNFAQLGASLVQIDEPILVTDLTQQDIQCFENIYQTLLADKQVKVLLQTYFGDIRDCYQQVINLPFDAIGLDFVEGKLTLDLVKKQGFPQDKLLFAGVVNGKNIWRNNYAKTLALLEQIQSITQNIVINTSCSLLHVPYTLQNETKLTIAQKAYFTFAQEKLQELAELGELVTQKNPKQHANYQSNQTLFTREREGTNQTIRDKVAALTAQDFVRLPVFTEREALQKQALKLPLLPTTTIGSFPQTSDVRLNRAKFKKGEITLEQYTTFNQQKIADCITLQEKIGLDVLVHGEFERNDMVEYFGESLNGFVFTEKAWVQSYGTRCVKPPIIWGDISRSKPITVAYSQYAQSLTDKPVKGMLTGPVTILNWSFPREDISYKDSVFQIGLAIADEVLDLEKAGINIIQIDEAALKEKLPLRKADWHSEYLDWAIPAFRLVHRKVKPTTQIHTHMCYSEFDDIIKEIDDMDADVISFEASRSNLSLIDVLKANHFKTEVGPGVYDIHSPRVPSVDEIRQVIEKLLAKIDKSKLWINPDCGLKTRGESEVIASLTNLVKATQDVRLEL